MRHVLAMLLVGLAVAPVVRLGAHHALSRVYDENRTTSMEGIVGRVLNQVPHPSVHLIVEDDRGNASARRGEYAL